MLATQTELLRAIIDHPTDDNVRLEYADLLDGIGTKESKCRAKFIRTQIRLHALTGGKWMVYRKGHAVAWCNKCIRRDGACWVHGTRERPERYYFSVKWERGFVATVRAKAYDLDTGSYAFSSKYALHELDYVHLTQPVQIVTLSSKYPYRQSHPPLTDEQYASRVHDVRLRIAEFVALRYPRWLRCLRFTDDS